MVEAFSSHCFNSVSVHSNVSVLSCWYLLIVFFHLVWCLPVSWYNESFSIETWTCLYYVRRLWILFTPWLLTEFLWQRSCRKRVGAPLCYCQVQNEVYIPQGRLVLFLAAGWDGSPTPRHALQWHHGGHHSQLVRMKITASTLPSHTPPARMLGHLFASW